MIDERCGARIVNAVLKFGLRCVRTLRVVDAPNQKVANILDVVLFDCHYWLSQALACSAASCTSLVSFFLVSLVNGA